MGNIKISLRKRGSTFLEGDTLLPITDYAYLLNKPTTFTPTAHNHDASAINAGTLHVDRIPAHDASKVNSGIFNKDRIPTTLNDVYSRKFLVSADGVPSSNLGSPTVQEMALFQEQFNNKTEFYDITKIVFESFDGTTWTDVTSTITEQNRKRFMGGDLVGNVNIPNLAVKYRITLRATTYVFLNSLYIYWSSQSHSTKVTIWKKHDSASWEQVTSSTVSVSAWPGHMYLPFPGIAWHPTATLGSHWHEVRIEFEPAWSSHVTYGTYPIVLQKLQLWGGYPAGKRTIYNLDENKGASFPQNVYASDFYVGANKAVLNNDSRLSDARIASDVSSWAKAASKPTYNQDEVGDGTTYFRVSEVEKGTWNNKADLIDIETMIAGYDTTEVQSALALKVPTARTIAGIDLVDNITVAELTAALNEASTSLKGVMSATDKARLDTLYALLNDTTDGSADDLVDTIQDILAIFSTYPEGADMVTALAGKVNTTDVDEAATASKIAKRNSSGDIITRLFRSEYATLSTTPTYIMVQHALGSGADNYIRPLTLAQLKTSLGSMPASDVYSWAKAVSKPTYDASEIGGLSASYRWLTDTYISTWNAKEPAITKGTTLQYFRGDMSLATMPTSLPASDVYSWAKAVSKPTYAASEIDSLGASYRWLTDTYISTWNAKADLAAVIAAKTTNYTFVIGDANNFLQMNSASSYTFTIPLNSAVAFPVGTELHMARYGAGEVTIAITSGGTIISEGSKKRINAQYQVVTAKKLATDTWILFGALKT